MSQKYFFSVSLRTYVAVTTHAANNFSSWEIFMAINLHWHKYTKEIKIHNYFSLSLEIKFHTKNQRLITLADDFLSIDTWKSSIYFHLFWVRTKNALHVNDSLQWFLEFSFKSEQKLLHNRQNLTKKLSLLSFKKYSINRGESDRQ